MRRGFALLILSAFPLLAVSAQADCLPDSNVLGKDITVLIENVKYHVIPEVMRLKDGDSLPKDLYDRYDSRLIAASLVARYHRADEKDGNSKNPEFDFQKNSLIEMEFDSKLVDSIQEHGFLNAHQVQKTWVGDASSVDGGNYRNTRALLESGFLKVQLNGDAFQADVNNPASTLLPKYSLLSFNKDPDGEKHLALLGQGGYGTAVAVFNDEIKNRTTMTPGD